MVEWQRLQRMDVGADMIYGAQNVFRVAQLASSVKGQLHALFVVGLAELALVGLAPLLAFWPLCCFH